MVSRNRRRADELIGQGKAACAAEEFLAAERVFEEALRLAPDEPNAYAGLSVIAWRQYRDMDASARYSDYVLAADPQNANALMDRAVLEKWRGDTEAAAGLAERVLDVHPNNARAIELLYKLQPFTSDDPYGQRVDEILQESLLSNEERSRLHFIKANIFEREMQFDEAFTQFTCANEYAAPAINMQNKTFYERFVQKLIQSIENIPPVDVATASPVPIFIVGMPRSGSTLLEQILTTQPAIGSVGESSFFSQLWRRLLRECYGETLKSTMSPDRFFAHLTPARLQSLRQEYLEQLRHTPQGPKRRLIVDKELNNYKFIPLLKKIFPESKIIHCRRHALDIGVSCFSRNMMAIAFSYRQSTIAQAIKQYTDVMTKWRMANQEDFYDVDYEHLVASPRVEIERVLKHCGLAFDEAALHPERSTNVVDTASSDQVRRKIDRGGIGRWPHYAAHIGPLVTTLGGWPWIEHHAHA